MTQELNRDGVGELQRTRLVGGRVQICGVVRKVCEGDIRELLVLATLISSSDDGIAVQSASAPLFPFNRAMD